QPSCAPFQLPVETVPQLPLRRRTAFPRRSQPSTKTSGEPHNMDLTEQLRVLQTAQGDPARLVLATVDLKYPKLAEAEREMLKETLEAAAIPHWCTEA